MPQASIIIPLYNRGDLIGETLQSVCGQTMSDLEAIVVDDGSVDNGPSVVQELALFDNRIIFLQRKDLPKGACHCRNIGLQRARGDYLLFLDSDDLLSRNCLKKRISGIMNSSDATAIIGQALIFENHPGDTRKLWNKVAVNLAQTKEILISFLRQDMPFANGGVLWSRKDLAQVGKWNENLMCFQDWEYHIRACIEGIKFTWIESPDFFVRRNPKSDQISQKHTTPQHLQSRFQAIDTVIEKLSTTECPDHRIRIALRGLVLRNLLDLADQRDTTELRKTINSPAIKQTINTIDRLLIYWLARRSPDWRWRPKYRRVAEILWHNLDFNSNSMKLNFMNCNWDNAIQTDAREGFHILL